MNDNQKLIEHLMRVSEYSMLKTCANCFYVSDRTEYDGRGDLVTRRVECRANKAISYEVNPEARCNLWESQKE